MVYKILYVNGPADGREEEFNEAPAACIRMIVPPTDIRDSFKETPSGITVKIGTEYSYVFWKQIGSYMLYKHKKHGMDANEYQHLALRTESNDFPSIRERLTPQLTYAMLIYISRFIENAKALDIIKKRLFYGKARPHEGVDFLLEKGVFRILKSIMIRYYV